MISIKKLVKRYDDLLALNQINLNIDKGVIFGLLGPNGAGKTTLISILNGLNSFQEGSVEIFGVPLHKNLKKIRECSSFVPQSLALYENLSVIENLRFFGGIQQIAGRALRQNIDHAVSINQLHSILDQKAETLSGGQKRRLNIAIGLLNNPEILYLDEPTVGIDPESRNDILNMIQMFKDQDKTVIYTSHYMQEIEKICDEVAIIDRGRIIKHGSLKTLLQEESKGSVVIELVSAQGAELHEIIKNHDGVQIIDAATIMIDSQNAAKVGGILAVLETNNIAIKQVCYGAENLESLFIRLTSHGDQHV